MTPLTATPGPSCWAFSACYGRTDIQPDDRSIAVTVRRTAGFLEKCNTRRTRMKLQDRTAIVTGGAQGIGAAIVRCFAAEGARVVIADLDEAAGERMVAKVDHDRVAYCRTDVSNSGQVQTLLRSVIERFGRLDVLVNNAGYHLSKTVEQTTEDEWDFLIRTNLTSTFLCSKYALPHLRATKGAIINISSMVGLVGQSSAGAYSATKGGQIAMTRGMALDVARDGIRVNAICPGWVETPLVEDWFHQQPDPQAARRYIQSMHPLGRIATAEEIGRVAVFLASDDSSYMTGVALPVDGAVTLGY
jgi:NAD(P)-dependent dehydrogenase (short-subunit alcohol dehydrogenase family)